MPIWQTGAAFKCRNLTGCGPAGLKTNYEHPFQETPLKRESKECPAYGLIVK